MQTLNLKKDLPQTIQALYKLSRSAGAVLLKQVEDFF